MVENFDAGLSESIFNVNIEGAVVEGAGFSREKKGDLAMKLLFDVSGETVSQMTDAIAGGSTISFNYYIPTGTTTAWWGIAWHTDPSKANIYHAAGINEAIGYQALGQNLGEWTNVSFTLPAGGPYYLYFGGPVGNWQLGDDTAYALIDNFAINGNVETFDYGIENSCFNVLYEGAVTDSEGGQIIEEVDSMLEFDGDSIGGNESIAIITASAYTGVQEINFTARWLSDAVGSRWGLSYTNNPGTFAYDDGKTEQQQIGWINCYTPRFGELKRDADVWYDYKVVISGGKWYMQYSDAGAGEYSQIASGNYYDGVNYFYFILTRYSFVSSLPTLRRLTVVLFLFSINVKF